MVLGPEFNKRLRQALKGEDIGLKPGEKADFQWGFCWLWAAVFQRVNGGQLITVMTKISPGHAVVFLNGRYYDFDHPQGMDSEQWRKHEVHEVADRYIRHRTVPGFEKVWKDLRALGPTVKRVAHKILFF